MGLVAKKRVSLFEMILSIILAIASMALKIAPWVPKSDFSTTLTQILTLIFLASGSLLSLGYLVGYYWLDKPPVKNAGTIIIVILYGLSLFLGCFSYMFFFLQTSGGSAASMLGV